mmetsp:Transcript_7745/g.15146  ORF Transcript_7745/g.15146 Transcript_7745/m.15146 type:complete len:205 (+) Transcript_7745:172-786(+)
MQPPVSRTILRPPRSQNDLFGAVVIYQLNKASISSAALVSCCTPKKLASMSSSACEELSIVFAAADGAGADGGAFAGVAEILSSLNPRTFSNDCCISCSASFPALSDSSRAFASAALFFSFAAFFIFFFNFFAFFFAFLRSFLRLRSSSSESESESDSELLSSALPRAGESESSSSESEPLLSFGRYFLLAYFCRMNVPSMRRS